MALLTGGEALAAQLVTEGARHVFGVPGVQLDWALDALRERRDEIRYVGTRHEQAASYAADGYARSSGRPGVCLVVPGPGMLNALAGLATGYACSSPIVFIAGQIPSPALGRGLGALHEIPDQSGILRSLTSWHALARTPQEVADVVHGAFAQVRSGRPRPVAVELPADVLATTAEVGLRVAAPDRPLVPDDAAIQRAGALLRAASRPLLYVGWGVQAAGGEDALRALAERLDAPVVMSATGKGSLDARHRLAFGTLEGRALRHRADLVLAVGTRFVDAAGLPVDCGEASLILVNADDADLVDPRTPDVAVHGDARLALEALLEEVPAPRCPDTWADLPGESRRSARVRLREVEPQRQILEALRTSLPDDALVVSDLTQVGYAAEIAYPVFAPRSYLTPGYQGTLGYAFATALGAKVANPHRPVVSLSGDGGFGWTLPELATAGQHGIAVTAVVFTDGAFGNVRRIQQEQFGGRYIASDLAGPDLRHVARAYDVGYHHAGSPAELGRAVRTAVASNVPAVVEMPVGELPTPWPLLREHLDGPGPSL